MIFEKANWHPKVIIRRFADDVAYCESRPAPVVDAQGRVLPGVSEFEGNVLLNEGIAALLEKLIGNSYGAFGNGQAYIGVGDATSATAANQTGLQAATNKGYVAMSSGYPSRSNQTITWRSAFGSADGNFSWQEFTVANAGSDGAVNLNRALSNQGTKVSGQVWTVDIAVTLS
jgi:hypothetical protein